MNVTFSSKGSKAWTELTGDAACHPTGDPKRRIAIVLDEEVIASPEVAPDAACRVGDPGPATVIAGDFTAKEVRALAGLIDLRPLPAGVRVTKRS